MNTQEMEAAILKQFAVNEAGDPEGAWACYHVSIVAAAGGTLDFADQVCRELRRRKLLKGEGRGTHATYYLTDKGKAAAGALAQEDER